MHIIRNWSLLLGFLPRLPKVTLTKLKPSFCRHSPLIWLGLSIFAKMNVAASLECDESTMRNWLQLVESHYLDNPYHNSTHAGDVMQATAYFLLKLRKRVRGRVSSHGQRWCWPSPQSYEMIVISFLLAAAEQWKGFLCANGGSAHLTGREYSCQSM